MKPHRIKNQLGFTVTEVMLAVICSSVLIVGLYQIFHSQQYHYIDQGYSIELQQNLRSGIYLLTKDIRLARYNPTEIKDKFGFVSNFGEIAFYTDKNEDGEIQWDIDHDAYDDGEEGEFIAYRLEESFLQRFNSEENEWQTVSTNVDALNFVFINDAGVPTTNHEEARAVQISLLVRSSKKDHKYTNTTIYKNYQGEEICNHCLNEPNYRRRLIRMTVRIRNAHISKANT